MKRQTQSITNFFAKKARTENDVRPRPEAEAEPVNETPVRRESHRKTFYEGWLAKYSWLEHRENEGMFCTVCTAYSQYGKRGTWTNSGCTTLREDAIRQHSKSAAHGIAVHLSTERLNAQRTGGLRQAFEQELTLERQCFEASLKAMYWLLTRELPHTTNFGSLLDLAKDMGCTYLTTLEQTTGHKYRSEKTMSPLCEFNSL